MDIAVLGTLEVRTGDGQSLRLPGARLRTLLILLAWEAGRTITSDRLVDGVWGEEPPASAGNALQALVSRLRRAAPGLDVETTPTGYRLVIEPDRIDAHRFARQVSVARTHLADDPARASDLLREALGWWRGPALADLATADGTRTDGIRARLARLDELRLAAWQDRIEADLRLGAGADLVGELEELVAAHPLREAFVVQLMRALVAAGRPGAALAAYDVARRHLRDTLGADPSPALAAAHLAVLRDGSGPVDAVAPHRRGNLPATLSSFVGRAPDVVDLAGRLRTDRLITLIGPGGSGKTRLSVEVGHALSDPPPDGIWLVELAGVTDPAEVPHAVLAALGWSGQLALGRRSPAFATDEPDDVDPASRVVDALAGKHLLLVLDNCEHLVAAVAHLVDRLLRAAPAVRVLASSREPLGIAGEQLWPVEPLGLPPAGVDPADAVTYPAVRLLLDRAVAVRPGFALDATTTPATVRICRALDGMPLAIELAAARLRSLPVTTLADRLVDRFQLLTVGSRTALPRHQTLRAVVDWSWDLLDDAERALLRRFAIFSGGAGLSLVEQVCAGGPVAADAVLDLLGALVDKSLIVLVGSRYRMLETIREYGRERLLAAGEAEPLRVAHARAMFALADAAEPRLRGPDQLTWLRRLAADHDNLHAALRAAVDAGDTATAVALTARLGWYWWLRGHRSEGAALSRDVLRLPGDVPREDRAIAYAFAALNGTEGAAPRGDVLGWFAHAVRLSRPDDIHPALRLAGPLARVFEASGDESTVGLLLPLFDDPDPWLGALARVVTAQIRINAGRQQDLAEAELRAGLEGFRAVGERWGIGFTLTGLGDLAASRGDFAQAVAWQRESIEHVRQVGSREDVPQLQAKLAHQLWLQGDRTGAREMLALARVAAEEVGFCESLASVEYVHAEHARYDGDYDAARAHLKRAVTLIADTTFAAQFRGMLRSAQGLVEAAAGEWEKARLLHAEALELVVPGQDAPILAQVLLGVADLAWRTGDPARAARLLGAGVAIRGGPDEALADVARLEREIRHALGESAYAEAYQTGLGCSYTAAAELAGFTAPARPALGSPG